MTCTTFKKMILNLNPTEVTRAEMSASFNHRSVCEKCRAWMTKGAEKRIKRMSESEKIRLSLTAFVIASKHQQAADPEAP